MSADADDLLRRAVAELAAREDCAWAGIFFVEDDELVLGPEAGTPEPARRTTVPVLWRDTRVAELAADGTVEQSDLEAVAEGIADLCLVGWDTGGEVWQS
jgi:putative methionine-R-sulfoxide reductase with GAF domain